MIQGTTAMMDRALRIDSRLLRAHLVRFVFVAFAMWFAMVAQSQPVMRSASGLFFFSSLTWVTFLVITFGGGSFFGTAITEEKEEMTLGLLQMAGVSPVAILLGKGTTRLLIALAVIGVQFPFTMLSITLGGVLLDQILATYCALGAYLLLIANLGLFLSVYCRTSRRSTFLMTIILLLYFFGPWLARMALDGSLSTGTLDPTGFVALQGDRLLQKIDEANIFTQINLILRSNSSQPILSLQVVSNVIAAACLFALSWLSFGYFNREEQSAMPEHPLFGLRSRRRVWKHWVPRVWIDALFWKEFHFMAGGVSMMIAKTIVYGVFMFGLFFIFSFSNGDIVRGLRTDLLGNTIMWTSLVFLFVEMCFYSSRIFREEIQWKTLPGLVALPRSLAMIVYPKWAACLLALIPGAAYFALGVMISPDNFGWFWERAYSGNAWFYYTFSQLILGFHFCTYLSTYIKYGAVPIVIVTQFVGFIVTIMTAEIALGVSNEPQESLAVLLSFASLLAAAAFHVATFARLRTLASQ